jgi:hypothetical protein
VTFYINWVLTFFFLKMTPLRVILCGESITHSSKKRKRFLDSDSGKGNAKNDHFRSKSQFFLESGSGKHSQGSGMYAIDFSHKITSLMVLKKIKNFRVPIHVKNHKKCGFLLTL